MTKGEVSIQLYFSPLRDDELLRCAHHYLWLRAKGNRRAINQIGLRGIRGNMATGPLAGGNLLECKWAGNGAIDRGWQRGRT